jgi:hypothetical protein
MIWTKLTAKKGDSWTDIYYQEVIGSIKSHVLPYSIHMTEENYLISIDNDKLQQDYEYKIDKQVTLLQT